MAGKKMTKVQVAATSPWGRRGDVVEVDASNKTIARHIKNGVLIPVAEPKQEESSGGA